LLLGNRLKSAPIALGCMRIARMDDAHAERLIRTALDCGIDLFDHADIYGGGESERVFARVLKRNPGIRESMLIQGKVGIRKGFYDASKAHILSAVEGSLKRLGVEWLDTLLLHRPDALMDPEEVAAAVRELKDSGKIRLFGVSNHNAGQIALLSRYLPGEIAINQMQFSLAHTPMIDAGVNVNMQTPHAVVREGGTLDFCRLHDITIQAWSPFQYGMIEGSFLGSDKHPALNEALDALAAEKGVSPAAVAVAWIMRHPAGIQTIVGTTNPDRLVGLCKASDITISREEWYQLYRAAGNPLP
ncbi:MAG: aldo/keto reductase, partial [Christensenellales bacterium]